MSWDDTSLLEEVYVRNKVYDTVALAWVAQTSVGGGTGEEVQVTNFPSLQDVAVVGLVKEAHDYLGLSYTGSNLTGVVFKTGGASGTTVATLTLGYDGSDNLISVTRT